MRSRAAISGAWSPSTRTTRLRDAPASSDALAAELADFVNLGRAYEDDLAAIDGFDVALLDEGGELVARVRERSAKGESSLDARRTHAIRRRNGLVTVLLQRVALVRGAAKYVFRHHPAIVREVTSAYERRKRAQTRRRKAAEVASDPGPET